MTSPGQLRMARRFATKYAGRLMYVPRVGWHWWDGQRWAPDTTRAAERAVDIVLAAALPDGAADVRSCSSATGRAAVLRIARSLPPLAGSAAALAEAP